MTIASPGAPRCAEPLYLGSAERPWFAWLQRAAPAIDTGVGLVIVPPFGFEAVCAHRALLHLATDCAAAGVSAVRIDLDGTGDSAGDDLDPDRIASWIASVGAAADLLRTNGASRVVLVGVRLGALLAVLAAADRRDIAGVVAIAPVVSGRRWLREMHALQLALGLAPTPPAHESGADVREAIGFALTVATCETIAVIDLEKLPPPTVPAMLVIDRRDMVVGEKWVAHLREAGVEVEHRLLPGYTEMMLDPHRTEIPVEILAATVAFAVARPLLESAQPASAVVPFQRACLGKVVEEPVAIDVALRAIVTRPVNGQPRRALVLLNAGSVRRVGPNRLYVLIARRLAAELGILVVRVDLSGIGDSAPRGGMPENLVYHAHALGDVEAIVAWCHREGAVDVDLAGLCSGGYYAREAAVTGQPLHGIFAINPGAPGVPDAPSPYKAAAQSARYRQLLRTTDGWKRLLSGGFDSATLRRLVRTATARACGLVGNLARRGLRRVGIHMPGDAGAALVDVAARQIAITFVFCADEPGLIVLREQAGDVIAQLERRGALSLRVLDGIDHTFTPRWSHEVLHDELRVALTRTMP
ncbi:MAG: alpha/beta hydrolase [Dokdonella sp.]